jgi:hypothetical protein
MTFESLKLLPDFFLAVVRDDGVSKISVFQDL